MVVELVQAPTSWQSVLHSLFSVMSLRKEHPNERKSLCSCRGNLVGIPALRAYFAGGRARRGAHPERAVSLVSRVFRNVSGKRGRSGLWSRQRGAHRRGVLLAVQPIRRDVRRAKREISLRRRI